jgi:hypothetical protein
MDRLENQVQTEEFAKSAPVGMELSKMMGLSLGKLPWMRQAISAQPARAGKSAATAQLALR